MELRNARQAIRKVAKKHGITEQEMVKEMDSAIQTAIMEITMEGNRDALAKWKDIPCAGEYPNAYELVDYLTGKLIANY